MKAPPKWAQALLLDAMMWWEVEHHGVPIISLKWGRRRGIRSSGTAWPTEGTFSVREGSDRTDAKLVLLHELAHCLRPPREHHSSAFWDTAWALFRWAKLPIRYCQQREYEYRKGAAVSYRRNRRGVA